MTEQNQFRNSVSLIFILILGVFFLQNGVWELARDYLIREDGRDLLLPMMLLLRFGIVLPILLATVW